MHRCLSMMGLRSLKSCAVDQELSAKLESELQMEQEMRDSDKLPQSITDFLESSSFTVRQTLPIFSLKSSITKIHGSYKIPPDTKKSF